MTLNFEAKTAAAAVLLALLVLSLPARSVPVEGIYASTAPVTGDTDEALRAAFAEALRGVLVKATGRTDAGRDPALLARFGDPSRLVQQYRRDPAGRLWAQFDALAVRRGLEAAGLPVWSEDRPLTIVWLAFDAGGGERDVLGSGGSDSPLVTALRRELTVAAEARGVPLVLPLRDSQDLAAVSYADVWGEFSEPVMKASARYRADAVLIGRARLVPAGMPDVRWTLTAGGERSDWRGNIADGPAGLAEHLAQRLASAPAAAGGTEEVVVLEVRGLASFDDYGLVLGYLTGLDVIESLEVARLRDDAVEFDLRLRGDRERLVRALAVRRIVEPVEGSDASAAGASAASFLRYRLGGAR